MAFRTTCPSSTDPGPTTVRLPSCCDSRDCSVTNVEATLEAGVDVSANRMKGKTPPADMDDAPPHHWETTTAHPDARPPPLAGRSVLNFSKLDMNILKETFVLCSIT